LQEVTHPTLFTPLMRMSIYLQTQLSPSLCLSLTHSLLLAGSHLPSIFYTCLNRCEASDLLVRQVTSYIIDVHVYLSAHTIFSPPLSHTRAYSLFLAGSHLLNIFCTIDEHVYLSANAILSHTLSLSPFHTLSFLHEVTYPTSSTLLMRMSIHLQTQSSLFLSPSHTLSPSCRKSLTQHLLLLMRMSIYPQTQFSLSLALSYPLSPSCTKSLPNIFYTIDEYGSLSANALLSLSLSFTHTRCFCA